MLLNFILSFVAVLFLAYQDYKIDKKVDLKDHWLKYLICLALGVFLIPYLLKWSWFQYPEIIGAVVLLGIFFSPVLKFVTKIFKIKKMPDGTK